jgi:hypothetical protein
VWSSDRGMGGGRRRHAGVGKALGGAGMDRLGALRARAVVLWVHVLEGSGTDGVDEMGSTGVMMEGGADFDQLRKRENVVVAAVVATGGRRPGLAPTTRFFSFRIVRPLSFYPAATVNKKKDQKVPRARASRQRCLAGLVLALSSYGVRIRRRSSSSPSSSVHVWSCRHR